MVIELAICIIALTATVAAAALALRWYRKGQRRRAMFVFVGVLAIHGICPLLVGPRMRGYVYATSDHAVTFLECPFKGVSYESMLSRFQSSGHGTELFRTFDRDWWNYYRWVDYATHPRWQLPFQVAEHRRPEPVGSTEPGESASVSIQLPRAPGR